ncbi:MAG TPA: Gfo/Idh/MocA family oxidoreductase [Saprospiraceae bacterium]|nr:Gfo/Idh/MocA family oxidoreductase [Saprospiraceae bacterium]
MKSKIKLAVFGAGYLGKIHLSCLKKTPFEVLGFFDPDINNAKKVEKETGIPWVQDENKLLKDVDAVDIVAPTSQHFNIAKRAILMQKHVFIEKPVCSHPFEAMQLMEMAKINGVIGQVGHVERYNPAFVAIKDRAIKPGFIEAHRLSFLSSRVNDISVVLDLMIHDLDLILFLVHSNVAEIRANGINVIHDSIDICNARLTFDNGCVANITASRISVKEMRKMRIFQKDSYITVDLLKQKSQIITLTDQMGESELQARPWSFQKGENKKYVHIEEVASESNSNSILLELNEFYDNIVFKRIPEVSLEVALKALELAHEIEAISKAGSNK